MQVVLIRSTEERSLSCFTLITPMPPRTSTLARIAAMVTAMILTRIEYMKDLLQESGFFVFSVFTISEKGRFRKGL